MRLCDIMIYLDKMVGNLEGRNHPLPANKKVFSHCNVLHNFILKPSFRAQDRHLDIDMAKPKTGGIIRNSFSNGLVLNRTGSL